MAKIFLTGATGYVGGRLAPRLIAQGHDVRCLARDPARLAARSDWGKFETVEADLDDVAALRDAMKGCEVAYYLIHSMRGDHQGFEERDRRFALNFAFAAREAETVKRIIYLGGLGDEEKHRSPHLASRQEVGDCLRATGLPVIEFRAAVIVGSGSASFEMIRYIVERLPVMVCPRWVRTLCQPIAIRDVLQYLLEALEHDIGSGKIVQIGGPDALTYLEMLKVYGEVRGLRRMIFPVPVLSPELSARWVSLITPLPYSIARPLVEGLRSEVVVTDPSAAAAFSFQPISYREAVRLAVQRMQHDEQETSWFDAYNYDDRVEIPSLVRHHEGMIAERNSVVVQASPARVYQEVTSLGGERGWPYADFLWEVRGWIDLLFGGPGMRRGRRSMSELRVGDAVDFWRVEAAVENKMVRLRAEMKVPGRAWLQYEIRPIETGTKIVQTAFFEPHGLAGHLYWYAFYIPHLFIFPGMVRRLARAAERPAE